MTELKLTDSNIKAFETAMSEDATKAIKHFERELITIRSGRATPALVEDLKIECYGKTATMRLKELASISAPEVRLIVIQPWDQGVVNDIESALRNSDLGVNPVVEGTLIRIPLPEISGTRREELNRVLKKKLEEAKISIRGVRQKFHNLIRDSLKAKSISEDHSRRLNELLQKLTDKFTDQCEQMATKKEQEIRTI